MSLSIENKVTEMNEKVVRLYNEGKFEKALISARSTYEIAKYGLDKNDPMLATSLNNLALFYDFLGDYKEALKLYQHALEIELKIFGENDLSFAMTLSNLAMLYKAMGNYDKAIESCSRSLEIRRNILGEDNLDVSTSMNNLATIYRLSGNFETAEKLYSKAAEVIHELNGSDDPSLALTLNNLAVLYQCMGRIKDAEKLCLRALGIIKQRHGMENLSYATGQNNLAGLYYSMGNYPKAKKLYLESLIIKQGILGKNHPNCATILNNLALVYKSLGKYDNAENYYRQSLNIIKKTLGSSHHYFGANLANLAKVLAATNRGYKALELMEQAFDIFNKTVGQVFSVASEKYRTNVLNYMRRTLDSYLSLVLQFGSTVSVTKAFDAILSRKGMAAEALLTQRRVALGGKYPECKSKLTKIDILQAQICRKELNGPGPEGIKLHRKMISEWNDLKEKLESELASQIPEMNLHIELNDVNCRVVMKSMTKNTVLIEFVRFDEFDFSAIRAHSEFPWKGARYLAFIISSGGTETVEIVDLGDVNYIDKMISALRTSISGKEEFNRKELENWIKSHRSVAEEQGLALKEIILDPLLPLIEGCDRVLLAPDGELNRLPFEILPMSNGRRLIDEYMISYVGVGRDILRFGQMSSGQPNAPIVIADPFFDLAEKKVQLPRQGSTENNSYTSSRLSRDMNTLRGSFGRLWNTKEEGENIGEMLGVAPWLKSEALETRLKACRSPHILHIATHGFFLENQNENMNQQADTELGFLGPGNIGRLSATNLENPLLRSGLALAGANTWLSGGNPPEEAEDGILTAEDVSGMDLIDTELVVLSACETGLGEIHTGEGVFGLRRSFIVAGAKTLVMSLWKVPDEQTQKLMIDFYQRLLNGQPRAEALREVQLAIKKQYPDPYYWGAWICQGDPGPLSRDPRTRQLITVKPDS